MGVNPVTPVGFTQPQLGEWQSTGSLQSNLSFDGKSKFSTSREEFLIQAFFLPSTAKLKIQGQFQPMWELRDAAAIRRGHGGVTLMGDSAMTQPLCASPLPHALLA